MEKARPPVADWRESFVWQFFTGLKAGAPTERRERGANREIGFPG
jgi:hypothetical protein